MTISSNDSVLNQQHAPPEHNASVNESSSLLHDPAVQISNGRKESMIHSPGNGVADAGGVGVLIVSTETPNEQFDTLRIQHMLNTHGHVHFPNGTINWSTVDWDALSPEHQFRLKHIKMHEEHAGHDSMHLEILLILIAVIAIFQFCLYKWMKRDPYHYRLMTLCGMWWIPFGFALYNTKVTFISVWFIHSLCCAYIIIISKRVPLDSTTPRKVYKFFWIDYHVCYMLGLVGYATVILSITGIFKIITGYTSSETLDLGINLMLYGLYYGLIATDLAEICAEKMVVGVGFYKASGIPDRQLSDGVCALCGHALLVKAGEKALMEKTYQLKCSHTYHEFCLRGWAIVGKKQTCPYCHERVDLTLMFKSPWERVRLMYSTFLGYVRWFICWQPIIIVIVHFIITVLELH